MKNSTIQLIVFVLFTTLTSIALALPTDEQQPLTLDCEAQHFSMLNENTAECSGHVFLIQGSLKIEGEKLVGENLNSEHEKFTLMGSPAKAQQQPSLDSEVVTVEGGLIEFFRNQKQIKASDNVKLQQGGRIVTSHTIDYNMITGKYSSSKSEQGEDRVRIVLPPRDNANAN